MNGQNGRAGWPAASKKRTAPDGLRVLVVAPQPFYEDRGTPIAVRHVLEGLSQLGYQVDVVTFPVGESVDIPGVRYFRVPNPLSISSVPIGLSFRKLWFDVFLFFAIRARLRERSYLCIHAVEEAAFLAVFAARGRLPVIYDMQSSMAEQLARAWWARPAFIKRILYACERWLVIRATYTMTSVGLAERVVAEAPGATVREWQYPSAIPSVTPDDVCELRAQLRIAPEQPVVVYAGSFEAYQGLSILINAMPSVLLRVPRAVFVLVGANASIGARMTQQLAGRVPNDAYRLVERQPRARIAAFLEMADVVLSPRRFGGNLPLKILEYLAAGRAIVATSIPAHQAILHNGLAVLAEPTSEGFAAAITGLLKDPAKVSTLQAEARVYATEHLNWIHFVRSVGELYGEVAAHG